jgi:hypothetical protein
VSYLDTGHISACAASGVVLPGGICLKAHGAPAPERHGGGIRGIVTHFSQAARRRMVERLMSLDWNAGPAHLVTLTWHEGYSHDAQHWHYMLKLWRERLERRYAGRVAGGLWRLELVPRKSGVSKGVTAPHYHVVVCWKAGKAPSDDGFRRWCSETWNALCEDGDAAHLVHGADVRRVHERNGRGRLLSYLSKYMCKASEARLVDENGEVQSIGRTWAVFGSPAFVVVCGLRMTVDGWNRLLSAIRAHGSRIGSWYLAHLSDLCTGVRIYGAFDELWRSLALERLEGVEVC